VKTKTRISIPFLLCATLVSGGCASLINSPIHNVRIDSSPQEASFKIVDQQGEQVAQGVTPETVALHTSGAPFQAARYYVSFNHPDYPETTETLKGRISGWYFLNALFSIPGFIGAVIVDPFTGTMYTLPDDTSVVLGAQASPVKADGGASAETPATVIPEAAQ